MFSKFFREAFQNLYFIQLWNKGKFLAPLCPLETQAAATDIYQWVRSWKVDDVGNAGVFDNVKLGTEADVFLRASLILCPHTPFWSSVQLSEQLIPPSPPLFPATSLHPSLLPTVPAYNPCSIRLIGAPVSPGSPSPPTVICLAMGIRPKGGEAGAHLQHVALLGGELR